MGMAKLGLGLWLRLGSGQGLGSDPGLGPDAESWATDKSDCLAVELHPHEPQRCLRSSSQELLTVPNCNTMSGSSRFSVAASCVWNYLPLDLQTGSNSLHSFKSSLKKYFYTNTGGTIFSQCHPAPPISPITVNQLELWCHILHQK